MSSKTIVSGGPLSADVVLVTEEKLTPVPMPVTSSLLFVGFEFKDEEDRIDFMDGALNGSLILGGLLVWVIAILVLAS